MGEINTHTDPSVIKDIDAVCLYHTAEYCLDRVCGTLPYGSANQTVQQMCENLPLSSFSVPVYAGVCGTDPTSLMAPYLKHLRSLNVYGVQNFPTVGFETGRFRASIESMNLGIRHEFNMLSSAQKLGLDIMPIVCSVNEAIEVLSLSPKKIIIHPGLYSLSLYENGNKLPFFSSLTAMTNAIHTNRKTTAVLGFADTPEIMADLQESMTNIGLDCVYFVKEYWEGFREK